MGTGCLEKLPLCKFFNIHNLSEKWIIAKIGQVFFNNSIGSNEGLQEWKDFLRGIFTSVFIFPDQDLTIEKYTEYEYSRFKITRHTSHTLDYILGYKLKDKAYLKYREEKLENGNNEICMNPTDINVSEFMSGVFECVAKSSYDNEKRKNKSLFVFGKDTNMWESKGTEFTDSFFRSVCGDIDIMIKTVNVRYEEIVDDFNKKIDKLDKSVDDEKKHKNILSMSEAEIEADIYEDGNLTSSKEKKKALENGIKDALDVEKNEQKNLAKSRKYFSCRRNVESVHKSFLDRMDPKPLDKFWDKNNDYVGCKNGTIILNNDKVYVRPRLPEDYVKEEMNASLKFGEDIPNLNKFYIFMKQFQPDDCVRRYIFKYFASLLYKGNPDKLIHVLCGEMGNNSKTTIAVLLQQTFGGELSDTIPNNLLTRPKVKAETINSVATKITTKHLVTFDEIDNGERFQTGTIKEYTGNGSMNIREHDRAARSAKMTAKIMGTVNRVPGFIECDPAIKARFRIIPCITTWTENAPNTPEDCEKERNYPQDPCFVDNVERFSDALLRVMVDYYPIWKREGLKEIPREMKEVLEIYWGENDPYAMFYEERFTRTDGDGKCVNKSKLDTVKIVSAYEDFKHWYACAWKNNVVPDKNDFKAHMSRLVGRSNKGFWFRHTYSIPDVHNECQMTQTTNGTFHLPKPTNPVQHNPPQKKPRGPVLDVLRVDKKSPDIKKVVNNFSEEKNRLTSLT
jgi:phage/plasmid-associated DNA primase